jgi:Subtilase family
MGSLKSRWSDTMAKQPETILSSSNLALLVTCGLKTLVSALTTPGISLMASLVGVCSIYRNDDQSKILRRQVHSTKRLSLRCVPRTKLSMSPKMTLCMAVISPPSQYYHPLTRNHTTPSLKFFCRFDAPWGLSRISKKNKLFDGDPNGLYYSYVYNNTIEGKGVDIYIIDSGVRITHQDFGGRASWGVSFVGETADNTGHGTHCAGTAAGSRFGVAKVGRVLFAV